MRDGRTIHADHLTHLCRSINVVCHEDAEAGLGNILRTVGSVDIPDTIYVYFGRR
jgi:hypothetical protein